MFLMKLRMGMCGEFLPLKVWSDEGLGGGKM